MEKALIKNRGSRLLLLPKDFLDFIGVNEKVEMRLEVADRGPRIVIEQPRKSRKRQHVGPPKGNVIGELTIQDVLEEKRTERALDRNAEMVEKRKARRLPPSCPIVQAYIRFCVPAGMPSLRLRDDGSLVSPAVRLKIREAKRRNKEMMWEEYFARASHSLFLTGKVKSFRASLPWLLQTTNIAKIEGGQFDNAPTAAGAATYDSSDFEAWQDV